ncbi:MAG: hypothetical protein MJ206_01165 [Bacilli bacterium]|nr:hypothetical protein [Bacilli bacterium]
MSKILIDLVPLGRDTKAAVQGIKIFLNKNKNAIITIIGEQSDLLTIKDHRQVNIYSFSLFAKKTDKKYAQIKDRSLAFALTLLDEDKDFTGFVTYTDKPAVVSAVKKFLKPTVTSPLIIATFANYKTHRVTCIGDLGYNDTPTNKDYQNYLALMSQYMKKSFHKENPEFKLLTYSEHYDNPLRTLFKNNKNYRGEIEGQNLLKCDTDIVLGHPREFLGIISGINHGISIYDEYIQDQVKSSVGIRLFSYPMFKNVLRSFHFEIDQKLTSGGNVLLGYPINIVMIDIGTIKQGVTVSLDLANKLETL